MIFKDIGYTNTTPFSVHSSKDDTRLLYKAIYTPHTLYAVGLQALYPLRTIFINSAKGSEWHRNEHKKMSAYLPSTSAVKNCCQTARSLSSHSNTTEGDNSHLQSHNQSSLPPLHDNLHLTTKPPTAIKPSLEDHTLTFVVDLTLSILQS